MSFYNVHLNRSVFSNNKFETVVFNNVTVQSSKVENSNFLHFWVKDSKFNGTDFARSYINGSKWSYSSLQNGTFQRGEINVVIFRSFEVNNFELVLSDVKNILDAPKTATFDFTYIIVGETEIKVN